MNRTLIIGLGSTGRDICDNLIERIEAGHLKLSNVPQFDVLVLETEQRDNIPSVRNNKLQTLATDRDRMIAMINNPKQYDEQINLSRWLDGTVIPRTLDPIKGAGGCRMAGRLLLFNPETYANVRAALAQRLVQLRAVTLEQIRRTQPAIPDMTTLNPRLRVAVVGTLCGGTASGTLIDLGYLLRDVSDDLGIEIDTLGLFTLPPLELSEPTIRANVFATLVEWNHFLSPGTSNTIRFPDRGDRTYHLPPYDRSYLAQPPSVNEIGQLKNQIGDYLFAMVSSLDFSAVDGKTIDAANFLKGLDKVGASRGWATVGVRTLEYPADLVKRVLSTRLIGDVVSQLLAPAPTERPLGLLRQLGYDEEGMKSRLGLASILMDVAARVASQLDEISEAQFAQAEALVSYDAPGSGALVGREKGQIDRELKAAYDRELASLQTKLSSHSLLADPTLAIATIDARLAELSSEIENALAICRQQNSEGLSIYVQRKNAARDRFREEDRRTIENPGCLAKLFGGGNKASEERIQQKNRKRELLQEFVVAVAEENLTTRYRIPLYDTLTILIADLRHRLMGNGPTRPGVHGQLTRLQAQLSEMRERLQQNIAATRSPFLQNPDLVQEWDNGLREAARQANDTTDLRLAEWHRQVRQQLDILPRVLREPIGGDRHDNAQSATEMTRYATDQIDRVLPHADAFFRHVSDTPIFARLLDIPGAMRWLTDQQALLNIDRTGPTQFEVEPKQRVEILFYDHAALSGPMVGAARRAEFEAEVERLVRNDAQQRFQPVATSDRHRISFISEFAAFSLNAMRGCQEGGASQLRDAYYARMNRPDQKPYSRADVFFLPISKNDFDRFLQARRLFLVGFATDLITVERAGLFQFRPSDPVNGTNFSSVQLDDNAAKLFTNEHAYNTLDTNLMDWYRAHKADPREIVEAMRRFAVQVPPLTGLRFDDRPLSERDYLKIVFAYWEKYVDVRDAFFAIEPELDSARRFWRITGEPLEGSGHKAPRDGYYTKFGNFVGTDRMALFSPSTVDDDPLLSGQQPV